MAASAKGMTLTLLLSACALVFSRDVHNAVGINVEGDLDLRNTARCWGDANQSELTQHLIVCSHLSLSLTNLDLHLGLSISCCGEHL